MQCPHCHHESRDAAMFCEECGTVLARSCPACGAGLRPTARFCDACGQDLRGGPPSSTSRSDAPRSSESDAERRQLTVVFCDLVGSTGLASRFDAEEWRDVVRPYQRAASDVVERFGGHVAQHLGDGLLVYFGWPRAHEDDPERAVRAALEIVGVVSSLELAGLSKGERLHVRIGIHTGPVVVGQVGGGSHRETLALGETTNLAARFQELAKPGTVVISATTLRLVQGLFLTEDLGPSQLRGVNAPVPAYRVARASGVRSRLDVAAAAGLTPAVGREQELGLLLDRWEQVREGTGQVVVISGEAGIGKSRLVKMFRKRLAAAPHTWLECRGSAYTQDAPLLPVIDLLQQTLAPAGRRQPLAQLESALALAGFEGGEALALMASLLSLPAPPGDAIAGMTPEARRRKTFAILSEWLLRLGREQPVVVLVEDLQWVDPSTLELLGSVVEQTPTAAVFALLTHRPDFRAPWPPRSHLTPLLLTRLTRAQSRLLVEGAARGRRIPEAWIREIVRRSDGIPLFVEELTLTLLESRRLSEGGEGTPEREIAPLEIPTTLRDSLTARLDQLGPVKEVARLCAVLGREFSYELLRAVSRQADDVLEKGLAALVDAETLYQRGAPPRATYLFKHALIQEAAYESLLKAERRDLHLTTARLLEEQMPGVASAQPELLAYHHTRADQLSQAISYRETAARRCIERSAYREAIAQLEQGLELVAALPEGRERHERELSLRIDLGVPLQAIKGYGALEVEQAFGRARELCQELGDRERLFAVLAGLSACYLLRADLRQARELAEELQLQAQQPILRVWANYSIGLARFHLGEFQEARRVAEEGIALSTPLERDSLGASYGGDPGLDCRVLAADALWFLGHPERALSGIREAIALARGAGYPLTLTYAMAHGSILDQLCGHVERAAEQAEATVALASEGGFPLWAGVGEAIRGYTIAALGGLEEGVARIRSGIDRYRSTGAEIGVTYLLALLARAYLEAGKPEHALAVLGDALAAVRRTEARFVEAELLRLKGESLAARSPGDHTLAESSCQEALEVARRQQARSWELRAAVSLSRLWQQAGRRADARHLLQPILAAFGRGLETADVTEARSLLAALA